MGGFFGVVSQDDCVSDLFYGTDYHSHLGTKRAGLAVLGPRGFHRAIHSLENSYFRSRFESELPSFQGNKGIGVISDTDPQPLIINSHLGTFGIVTVGRIANVDELAERAFSSRRYFSETSSEAINPTEVVAMLICEEDSFVAGIERVFDSIKGSCSMLILTEEGIYAARDKLGRTPIILGSRDGARVFTSETNALPNLDYQVERYLGPGEIALLNEDGCRQLRAPGDKMQICAFLWVYYGFPTSDYENINVEASRYRNGTAMAQDDDVTGDMICGIPDSGIGHAMGYANGKNMPYMRPYVKYTPTWPRSFMPQSQDMRDLVARMKLIPNRSLIKDKRIIFCDDSIVRGTQLNDNVNILYEYGAREIHMRIACPVLIHPCPFINFSTSRSAMDLAGRKAIQHLEGRDDACLEEYGCSGSPKNLAMIECIRKRLNLTSLKFQSVDALVGAIGLPKEKLCTHCWDGSSYF